MTTYSITYKRPARQQHNTSDLLYKVFTIKNLTKEELSNWRAYCDYKRFIILKIK